MLQFELRLGLIRERLCVKSEEELAYFTRCSKQVHAGTTKIKHLFSHREVLGDKSAEKNQLEELVDLGDVAGVICVVKIKLSFFCQSHVDRSVLENECDPTNNLSSIL